MVIGTIIASEIIVTDDEGLAHRASVEYEYLVGDQLFSSSRIRIGSFESTMKADAQLSIRVFPAGSQVRVFYNPNNPAESVLEKGVRSENHAAIIFSLLIIVLGVKMLLP